jgi:hypothetical protein
LNHNLALRANGTVAAWGADDAGQSDIPPEFTNLTFTAIAAGGEHSLALLANNPPVVSIQPANATIAANQTATLSVTFLSALDYQWYAGASGDVSHPITGAELPSFTTPPLAQNSTYWVRASNIYGGTNSATATVVIAPMPIAAGSAKTQTLLAGQNTTLSVAATGLDLTYQWRKNGVNIPGAVGASLVLQKINSANAGRYDVVITNPAGSITSAPITLNVKTPPTITVQPLPVAAVRGVTVRFSVTAVGDQPLQYVWQRNRLNLPSLPIYQGVKTSTLSLLHVGPGSAGKFRVIVSNASGTATSQEVALRVN